MKASELIEALKADITVFGDQNVAFTCDDVDGGLPIPIDATDIYSDNFILLVCEECHWQAVADKCATEEEP